MIYETPFEKDQFVFTSYLIYTESLSNQLLCFHGVLRSDNSFLL